MSEVVIYPNSTTAWRGTLIEEGPEQSVIKITAGPALLVGQTQCFVNSDWSRVTERKKSGPERRQDYDLQVGAKTKETAMASDEQQSPQPERNYVTIYNELVAEASGIGLNGYKPIATRFRDVSTGAKRCEALAEAIEAHKAKLARGEAASPGDEVEQTPPKKEARMPRVATAKKAKRAAPAKKVVAKAAPKSSERRTGVVEEFGTREGTFREKILLVLHAKKNKPVPLSEVAKAAYGKGDEEARLKAKAAIVGLNMTIEDNKLPYKPIEYEGRVDEATVMLATKSGR